MALLISGSLMRAKVWKIFRDLKTGRNNLVHRALLLENIQAQQLTLGCAELATNYAVLAHHVFRERFDQENIRLTLSDQLAVIMNDGRRLRSTIDALQS